MGAGAFAPSADSDLSYFSKAAGSCSLWFVQTSAHRLGPCTSLSASLKYRGRRGLRYALFLRMG